jgi:hypothetical protein
MAVKKQTATKTSTRGASATKTKAAPKKKTTRANVTRKSTTAPKVRSETSAKAGTPKARAGAKKVAAKKAPVVKLTDRQLDLLKTVHGTKDSGYLADKKAEAKTLETLASKKLIKKGAKDKTSGHVRYHVSKAGEKHVSSQNAPA